MIRQTCPQCRTVLELGQGTAPDQIVCPYCGSVITLNVAAAPSPIDQAFAAFGAGRSAHVPSAPPASFRPDPKAAEVHNTRGTVLARKGNYADAVHEFTESL